MKVNLPLQESSTMANQEEHTFEIMAKPGGPLCNLDCVYCFYICKKDGWTFSCNWKMDSEILEIFVRDYIRSRTLEYPVQFVWQGVEPCLMGLDFFRNVLAHEKYKSFQRVFIVSRCHFPYVLPTWAFALYITKYPIGKIHWW